MKRRSQTRARQRGAIFVESIIVITFFTTCFIGTMFFRELYVKKARVQRVARAAAMSFAMNACQGDPNAGLDKDMPQNQPPPSNGQGPPDANTGRGSSSDKNASSALAAMGGAPFDPTTSVSVHTTAEAVTQKDPASKKQGFTADVGSTSTVGCMDQTSTDQATEVLPKLEQTIKSVIP